jgi:undecaprenyl-diphosphatase
MTPIVGLSPVDAAILGLVEGLTEYLPVSSTGHLILAGRALGLTGDAVKDFDVVIQLGAVCAVLGLYRARVAQMARGLVGRDAQGRRLLLSLVVAFVPAAVTGFLFEKPLKERLFFPLPVAAALAVGGVVMIILDRTLRRRREREGHAIEGLTLRGALIIGLCQCLALWPGTSRSLVTILGGLAVGLTPVAAAEFSFLLALPTLGAATLYDLAKHGSQLAAGVGPLALVIGMVVAAVSAAFAVKGFVAWLVRHGLVPFGVYRIALAVAVFWILGGSTADTAQLGDRERGLHRMAGLHPCVDAAGQVGDVAMPRVAQEAGCRRRSIPTRAVDDQGPVRRQLAHALAQLRQWHVNGGGDTLLLPFPRRPHVQHDRRRGGTQLHGQLQRGDTVQRPE